MIFTVSTGKSILPESGPAVRLITLLGNGAPYYSVSESWWRSPMFHWEQLVSFLNFLGWNTIALYPFSLFPGLAAVLVCLGLALVALHFRNIPDAAVFVLHMLGMMAAYSLYVGGDWFHFRYTTSPGLLFSAFLAGMVFQHLTIKPAMGAYVALAAAGIVILHVLFNPLLDFYPTRLSLTPTGENFYESANWLNQNVPASSIVGAFQTGVIGFYTERPIVNLDGKVNDAAYHAIRDKTMWQYLCQSKVDYLADWPSVINDFLINRSAQWREDNLTLVKQMTDVDIYAFNRANCLPGDEGQQ
jgi:hypothetical protein